MNFQQTHLKNPEDVADKWKGAWNNKDAFAIANLFVPDAEFVNVVGLWWHNRADIWKAHDYGFRVIFPNSTLRLRKVSTRLIGATAAVVHVRMRLSGQTANTGTINPGDRKNVFTFVLQKKESGWVVVSAHNTDVIPGKETNLTDETGNNRSVNYRRK